MNTKKEDNDLPTIIFENTNCQMRISYWLRLIKHPDLGNNNLISKIKRDRTIRKASTKTKEMFGLILKLTGIDSTETCRISGFNPREFSFDIELVESGQKGNMKLRLGDYQDTSDELTIELDGLKRTYECFFDASNKQPYIRLYHYTKTDPTSGNSCYRFFSKYRIALTAHIGLETVLIDITKPGNCRDTIMKLDNEDELVTYLLGLSVPIEIDKIYKSICDITGLVPKICPSISLESKWDKTVLTNLLRLEYGYLKKLVITKDGYTVDVDKNGSWQLKPPVLIADEATHPQEETIPKETIEKVLKFKETLTDKNSLPK